MSAVWISVIVVGLATMAIKAAGPLLLARRSPPPRAQAALEHLAPALLAALVVTQALGGDNGGFTVDARLAANEATTDAFHRCGTPPPMAAIAKTSTPPNRGGSPLPETTGTR